MGATLALFGGSPVVTEPTTFVWPPILPDDHALIGAMLERRELSYFGREGEVAALEDAFSQRVGVPFALTCSSGTTALHSAYFGLGLEPGDEVIAPTMTFLATVMPLFVVNATPVLVDCEPDTGNIEPLAIEAAITSRTRAIVVVHLNGHPCDMAPILAIARRHGLKVVEDCSHAHGATWNGAEVGGLGDVAAFSLQGSKLTAAGQGGILLTRDRTIFERAVLLGHFRVRAAEDVTSETYRPYASTGYGLNYRMHPLAAGLARRQFAQLDAYIADRTANLERLSQGLEAIPGIRAPTRRAYATRHSYCYYKPLYVPEAFDGLDRRLVLRALQAECAPIEDSSSPPLHCEPLFQRRDDGSRTYGREANRRIYAAGDCPAAELYSELSLRIPPYTDPQPRLMDQILEAIDKVWRHRGELLDYARRSAA